MHDARAGRLVRVGETLISQLTLHLCEGWWKSDSVIVLLLFFSEPIIEEGEAEVENTLGKDGESFFTSLKYLYSLERGTTNAAPQLDALPGMQTGNSAESSPAAVAHKRNERPRCNSSSSGDRSRFTGGPAGGSVALGGKFVFPNPVGSQCKPWLVNSPGSVHKQ